MVCDRKFCKKQYYKTQAQKGAGFNIKRYTSSRRQQGYGLLSNLAKRYAIPIAKFLGEQALKGGTGLISEILPGINLAKRNLKRKTASTLRSLGDSIEQSGLGYKKRRRISSKKSLKGGRRKSRKTSKIISRDIFKTF